MANRVISSGTTSVKLKYLIYTPKLDREHPCGSPLYILSQISERRFHQEELPTWQQKYASSLLTATLGEKHCTATKVNVTKETNELKQATQEKQKAMLQTVPMPHHIH